MLGSVRLNRLSTPNINQRLSSTLLGIACLMVYSSCLRHPLSSNLVPRSLSPRWNRWTMGIVLLRSENLIRRCYRLMRFLTCTSHGVVHCTSKNQINQEQLQEKCRREVGVMLISVRTQLPDDMTPARSNNVTKIVDDRAVGVMEFSPYNAP